MCSAFIEIYQPHHITVFYPDRQREITDEMFLIVVLMMYSVHVLCLSPPQNFDLVLQVGVVHLFFLHTLQGVKVARLSLSHQKHFRKRAAAQTRKHTNINNTPLILAERVC